MNQKQSTLYNLLQGKTRKRLARKKWRLGKTFQYAPNANLVRRLSKQLNISKDDVLDQLNDLREYLLKYPQYY
ncbi:MAG: hypothetical protein KA717_39515 [Woronichinia naegeliana WA131]|jgi:energy-converting hydrogenase A subunit M|uniref:Uncharacterized protein n=1 Tax=Woronichinia naegeliana WA131 TaxID=2824559 RepID=A0A977KZQ3_9CYAN|nr:MAG: hypothetical protein KA717_39515 [Woronichinia naegeliana WA131]